MKSLNTTFVQTTIRSISPLLVALVASTVGVASAQDIIAVSGHGRYQITLAGHPAMVTFIPGDISGAQEALKNASISVAEGKAVGIAARTLPIPFVGGLPVEGALHVFGKFRKQTVKGVNVAYLPGLAADRVLQSGENSFIVPKQTIEGASPLLVRIRPSATDSTRIVRGVRVSMKNGSTVEVLGTEQDVISCAQETRSSGDVVLTTRSPLEAGEYAVVLEPARSSSDGIPSGLVWDFRVQ